MCTRADRSPTPRPGPDGCLYTWDFCQDAFYNETTQQYCKETDETIAPTDAMVQYHLALEGLADSDTLALLGKAAPAKMWYDTNGTVLSVYYYVESMWLNCKQWDNVDWEI